jgi:hypothetical protein
VDTVDIKEPEVEDSALTIPFVGDFAVVEGFLFFGAFFPLRSSGVAVLYLYSMKSGSLSQTKTS